MISFSTEHGSKQYRLEVGETNTLDEDCSPAVLFIDDAEASRGSYLYLDEDLSLGVDLPYELSCALIEGIAARWDAPTHFTVRMLVPRSMGDGQNFPNFGRSEKCRKFCPSPFVFMVPIGRRGRCERFPASLGHAVR